MENRKMRIWWCPQVGVCKEHFYIPVDTVEEAKKIMDVLAYYDCYQMNQNIKGDYCNCGGVQMWDEDEQEWNDWYYEDEDNYLDDVDCYVEVLSPQCESLKAAEKYMRNQVHFD